MMKKILFSCLAAFLGNASYAATEINLFVQSSVASTTTDTNETSAIPSGVTVTLTSFGCMSRGVNTYTAVQWGSGSSWTTIKACWGSQEFKGDRSFIGDGAKRFRAVRTNSGASSEIIAVWVTGYTE